MTTAYSINTLLSRWQAEHSNGRAAHPPRYDGPDLVLSGIVDHTAEVQAGSCFVARVRTTSDGHPYIAKALKSGATLIIGERDQAELDADFPPGTCYLQTDNSSETMAWLAAAWHSFPSNQLDVIGVTGTNGKTTVIAILYEIMRAAGLQVGMISTIKAIFGDVEEPTGLHVTTPSATAIQGYLRRMVDAGLTHAILETTSHGLAQHRVTGINFRMGIFTNLTHEHLFYHQTFDNYRAAKRRLFELVAKHPAGIAILNQDDPSYADFAAVGPERKITYGLETQQGDRPDLTADQIRYGPKSTTFQLQLSQSTTPEIPIRSRLVGRFNVANMLAAAAAAEGLGIPSNGIRDGLEAVDHISGRMERIDAGQPFLTLVDFAHTPDALANAIRSARQMIIDRPGRVIAVFGSAGLRDKEKRHLMAEISAQEADLTVLTAEDPRSESLDEILAAMAAGCVKMGGVEGETFWRVPDRGRAIYFALTLAAADDILLICGKGHEQSMCFGSTEYPWDDRHATRIAISQWIAKRPMTDLGLPSY